jgi:hypothetical protein
MSNERPAVGERLSEIVELGAVEFRPESLDGIERRLKMI